MIMNMNEKGRQTKLLAAIAVLAMVLCVFAIAIPADAEGNTYAPSVPSDNVVIVDDVSKLANFEEGKSYVINEGTNLNINSAIKVDEDVEIYLNGGTIAFVDKGSLALTGGTNGATLYVISGSITGATSETSGAAAGNITVGANSAIKFYGGSMQIDGVDIIGSNGMLDASNGELQLSIDDSTYGMEYTVSQGTVIIDGSKGYKGIWKNDTMTVNSGATLSVVSDLSVSSASFTNNGNVTVASGSAIDLAKNATQGKITFGNGASFDGTLETSYGGSTKTAEITVSELTTSNTGFSIEVDATGYPAIADVEVSGEISVVSGYANLAGVTNIASAINGFVSDNKLGSLTAIGAIGSDNVLAKAATAYGDVSAGTITVSNVNTLTLAADTTFTGTVNAIGTDKAVVASVSGPFTVDDQVEIKADAATATKIVMTPAADTAVSGTITLGGKVDVAESMMIPNGSTFSIASTTTEISIASSNTLTILGDVSGTANKQIKADGSSTGTVNATNKTAVQQYVDGTVGDVDTKPYTTDDQLIADLNAGYNVTIDNSQNSARKITIDKDVTMNGNTLTVIGNGKIIIGAGVTFTMNAGSQVIYGDDNSSFTFDITGTSANSRAIVNINEANLCIPVQKGDYALVEVTGKDMEINNAFSSYYVGYGRTAHMTGTAVTADIDVVGTLYLSGTLRDNSTINVYQGGEVIVSEGETFQIIGTMNIDNGSAQIDGTLTVGSSAGAASLNVENDGTVKVSSTGTLTISSNTSSKPYNILSGNIDNEGTVNMSSKLIGAIKNSGTVNFNGVHENTAAGDASTIFMVKSGATLNAQSVTAVGNANPLVVTDQGCYLKTVTSGSSAEPIEVGDTAAPWATANSMTLSNVKNVKVTVTVAYETVTGYSERQPVNTMAFEGSVTPVTNSTSTIGITAGAVDVVGTVTLGKVNINVGADAVLNVSGTVNAPEAGAAATNTTAATFYSINGNGTVNVTGLIKSIDELDAGTLKVNAIHYVATEESRNWNFYTTLKAALDNGVTDMDVLGDLYILEDTTIPAGVTVEGTGNAYIGSSDLTDVTLIIENGGKLIIGKVTVYGTLDIRNTDTGLENTGDIIADTSNVNEDDKTALYTNIYNALSTAGDGDVVTVTKPIQDGEAIVYVDSNLTVPAGVTLVLPAGKEICILAGSTLTVDGTFDVKGDVTSRGYVSVTAESPAKNANEQYYFTNEDAREKKAAIVVTGEIVSNAELTHTTYSIAGAYYLMDGRFHITTLDKAAPVIGETDNYQVSTYGSVIGTDVSITGTNDVPVTLNVKGDITVSSLTMQNAIMNIDAGKAVTGTFGSAEGTVTFQYVKVGTAFTMTQKTVQSGETSTPTLYVDGDVARYEGSSYSNYPNKDRDALVEFGGDVKISDFGADFTNNLMGEGKGDVVIAAGATVSFARNVNADTMTMTLDDLSLNVEGTLTVNNGATLNAYTAGKNDATVIVTGTLDVSKKTDTQDAGAASIQTLYVGGTPEQISRDRTYAANLGADATVTGAGINNLARVYAFPGSTVNAENTTNKGFASVEFYYNDILVVTVWAAEGTEISNVYPAEQIGNALFQGWMYEDDNGVMQYTSTPTPYHNNNNGNVQESYTTVKVGTHDKVYASVDLDAYMLVFYVDAGVDAIYVDGDIVDSKGLVGQGENVYPVAWVSAGTHEITVKLSNGYVGVVEMSFDGNTVTDGKITIDASTYAGQYFKVSITNIDAGNANTDTSGDSGSELGLTDYLLIVLVVLIVVMAIIVAIRLMRS